MYGDKCITQTAVIVRRKLKTEAVDLKQQLDNQSKIFVNYSVIIHGDS